MSTLAANDSEVKPRSTTQIKKLIWTLLALLITAFFLFPFYLILESSLMAQTDVLRYPPPFVPPQVTLEGYTSAFETSGQFIRTSLIYGFGTILVTMIIATPAAYTLARVRSRIGLFLLIALILAQMAPGFVVANSLYAIFSQLKLINTYIAVILADSTAAVPFAIIIMRAFMLSIPSELSEAALVDGAGHWKIFWSIVVPISRTAIITAALFAFLAGWGDFLFALTLTNSAQLTPITVGIYRYIGTYSVNWPAIMATAMIATVPAIILLTFAQRYIAAGLTAGAIKE
jgi:multiple sugar transport system permease protein